ncbi:sensor histidine kinase [Acetohalobium arabaticum]|uniref:Signal transduction histidine kinase, LytS n=1 Tax=Acetohalobium arabaticum (strain ATCC 49924 / DSM 5501 / Z-7288) TaxID=574087 RepID=D9QU19_ACEAZ|nr:PocR ligand-binding domain-containing protein [Acetohalobium arabaticum]ADL13740.1 signal transduction histidine kinase, LytS [Acetohalobium arabaticum DSM 5501]
MLHSGEMNIKEVLDYINYKLSDNDLEKIKIKKNGTSVCLQTQIDDGIPIVSRLKGAVNMPSFLNIDQDLNLTDLIDVDILQQIQDRFAEATGLAAIIVDDQGDPVTEPSNFSDICSLVLSTDEGKKSCFNYNFSKDDFESKEDPVVFHCHMGFVDLVIPIIVADECFGVVKCGQILPKESEDEIVNKVKKRLNNLNISNVEVEGLLQQMKQIPRPKINAAATLLSLLANYIVEMSATTLIQKQLHFKNYQLMQEVNNRMEVEKNLQQAELKALQSQMNPHFLFNSLNIIARLAFLEGADQTEEMIHSLSDLLRYSLRKEEIVTLGEELNYIKDYIKIQKARFGERIEFVIDVDEDLLSYKIPFMSLQPLVENGIIHGLEPKDESGKIEILSEEAEDKLIIKVVDDGIGIKQEKIREIIEARERTVTETHTSSMGINNVHQRLKHYYGSKYGVQIYSTKGEGTEVRISFPKLESGGDDDV